jgi:hypothetical protein
MTNNRFSLFWWSSPANFYQLAGTLAPWFGAAAAILATVGLYMGFFVAPTDAQQGEAYRLDGDDYLFSNGFLVRRVPYLEDPRFGHVRSGPSPHRRHVFVCRAMDGRFMGKTDLGGLLGVGCPINFDPYLAFFVPRLYRPQKFNRRRT